MAYLAIDPVTDAVFDKLNVSAVTSLATGGLYNDLPRASTYPCVLMEVSEREQRGFGTVGFPEMALRVRVFSQAEGSSEASGIMQAVIQLLRDQPLTITGYAHAGLIFYDDTLTFPNESINGVKVRELVSNFRIYAEES